MVVRLVEMRPGERGVVRGIEGGFMAGRRIQSMGIRVGKPIKKETGHLKKGPQTVLVDSFKVAIGFGMAAKILVEVKEQNFSTDGHR